MAVASSYGGNYMRFLVWSICRKRHRRSNGGWFNIRLNNRADLDGLKMRIRALLVNYLMPLVLRSAYRRWGGLFSMQTGVIDAVNGWGHITIAPSG